MKARKKIKPGWIIGLFLLLPSVLPAQDDSSFITIGKILIEGNIRTKEHIILRELPFKAGDSLPLYQLRDEISLARQNVYNTKLFKSVEVVPGRSDTTGLGVRVRVVERWYTYPFPYVKIADRSFNVWWHTYHASLDRLSYGIWFIQQNLSGRNDNLEIKATAGFNHQIDLLYTSPYLSPAMQSRIRLQGGILSSREIPFGTSPDNKLEYFRGEHMSWKQWYLSAGYLVRKHIRKKEWLTFRLDNISLSDTIQTLNPDYFSGNSTREVFPTLSYNLRYDATDNILYPLKGYNYELTLKKQGFGWEDAVNAAQAIISGNYYLPLGRMWFGSLGGTASLRLPFDQPYFNSKAIGYDKDYLRGYEYYVIDGSAFLIARADLKKKLFYFQIPTSIEVGGLDYLPFTIYAKVFSDAGRSWSTAQTQLGNKWLWGGGLGLDIVTVYDICLSVNLSINSIGNKGLYFHKIP